MILKRVISLVLLALIVLFVMPLSSRAEAPDGTMKPRYRPGTVLRAAAPAALPERAVILAGGGGLARSPRPRLRPGRLMTIAQPAVVRSASARVATARTPRPILRPDNLLRRHTVAASGMRTPPSETVYKSKRGAVCGVKAIRGEKLPPIPAKLKGCGLQDPVRVTEISGVKMSTPITVDCTTAKALQSWIERGAKPAVGRLGGGVSELKIAASYSCRTRNNKPGAKISEHGRGRAVDISAVILANGVALSVLKDWNNAAKGKVLKKMHKSACGPFGTVLGPSADKYHKDHFHFDTARYRSGSYCR